MFYNKLNQEDIRFPVVYGQSFVKNPDMTVEKLLKSESADVISFERMEVGEGIEKKVDNFAEEVMAQARGE